MAASSRAESDPENATTLGRASVGLSVAGVGCTVMIVVVVLMVTRTNATTNLRGVILVVAIVVLGVSIICTVGCCAYKYSGTCITDSMSAFRASVSAEEVGP